MTGAPRLLHVNTERTWRGGEQQTLYLLDGLRARGIEGLLVAKQGSVMAERARRAGHTVIEMRMHGEVDFSIPWKLARLVRRHKLNILHAHTSHAHVYVQLARLLCSGARQPKVVVHRRVDFSIYRRSFLGLNGIKYKYGVDRYITVSEAIRQVLIADGLDALRIEVVHSGIDLQRIIAAPRKRGALRAELGVADDAPLVANVAHCADHKGQTYFVQAIPKILARHPQARFAIVGDGELRAGLMEEARALGVADRIAFPGFRRDVPALLRAFDVFVMPSHLEGLGTSVLDALAAKLPVVGTMAGGIPEILRHEQNGLLCPVRDPQALAEAVCRLLAEPAFAGRLAEQGFTRVCREFSTQAMVEGVLRVYLGLL